MEEAIWRVNHDDSVFIASIDDSLIICASSWRSDITDSAL